MRLDFYYNEMKDARNTCAATITYKDREMDLANTIVDVMEHETFWKFGGAVEDFFIIPMDNYADYLDFKRWFCETKKKIKGCLV